MKTKVIIRLMGKSWLVTNYETNEDIAMVAQGWHFITLCKVKGWDIVNKTALSPEISNKIN